MASADADMNNSMAESVGYAEECSLKFYRKDGGCFPLLGVGFRN